MKASATHTIDRPITDVFTYIASVENMGEWVEGVGEATLVSGDGTSIGDRYACAYTYNGRTTPMELTVTAYDPPHRFGVTATEGPFPFDGVITLEATETGTQVTNTIDAGTDSRATTIIFRLFGPLLRRMMARRLHTELRVLEDKVTPRSPAHVV